MAVIVTRAEEPEGYDMCVVRRAGGCSLMTGYWWGGGCITVCLPCSQLPEVTDASMRALCKKDGWGPIPTENTDLPAPAKAGT